jgi:hypothetical protein
MTWHWIVIRLAFEVAGWFIGSRWGSRDEEF